MRQSSVSTESEPACSIRIAWSGRLRWVVSTMAGFVRFREYRHETHYCDLKCRLRSHVSEDLCGFQRSVAALCDCLVSLGTDDEDACGGLCCLVSHKNPGPARSSKGRCPCQHWLQAKAQ